MYMFIIVIRMYISYIRTNYAEKSKLFWFFSIYTSIYIVIYMYLIYTYMYILYICTYCSYILYTYAYIYLTYVYIYLS